MGVETRKRSAPPLPAPTETESTILSAAPTDLGTDLGTDVSRLQDEKSSYSLPDDGTPVTIRTGHRASKSQTSLLIEYFEGGKGSDVSSDQRKPSVRVRLTPSSKHRSKGGSDRDRIEITATKSSSRKASLSRRATAPTRSEIEANSAVSGDQEDAGSYASATEESNVSRNPIDIEIDRSGNARRRRPASPLIPAADAASKSSYLPPTMSEISAIPTDSFLDGSGPTTSFRTSEVKVNRSRSPSRTGDYLAGGAVALGALAAADKLRNNKSRGGSDRERVVVDRSRDKDRDRDRRHRQSKSRSGASGREDRYERSRSPRRRSSKTHSESIVSAADSSVVSSALAPSHRSMDQQSVRSGASKASSINNPKLLETVEDAIRRLILPELNALKREQSKHKSRRDSTTSTGTSVSRDEYASDRRRSAGTEKSLATPRDSMKAVDRRDREARNAFDDSPSQSALSQDSIDDSRDLDDTPMRSTDRLKAAAAGAAVGAAAVALHEATHQSPSDDKRTRRRRRAELRSRGDQDQDFDDDDSRLLSAPSPPMPLMSEVNASDVTRASILSADTDRPHSATEELTPSRDLHHDEFSPMSSPTPTRTPQLTLQALGTQHANISHGDLRALPRQRTGEFDDYVINDHGHKVPSRALQEKQQKEQEQPYDDDLSDEEAESSKRPYSRPNPYDYYSTQDVPPPLKYVPYQPERRGLSPIESESWYTEAGSEAPKGESRATHHTAASVSSIDERSLRHDERGPSPMRSELDDRSLRDSGMERGNVVSATESELDPITGGQAVRAVGLNPDFVQAPGIESNVASLVDGSMLDGSVMTTDSQHFVARDSMGAHEDQRAFSVGTASKQSLGSYREYADERAETPASGSQRSRQFVEYELDEEGRKVPQASTAYRQSPTASEAAITSAAVGAAAAVLKAQYDKGKQTADVEEGAWQPAGVQRNQSFKERTRNGPRPGLDSPHNSEKLGSESDRPKMGFNSLPDPQDPMPEIGDWDDDLLTNPSMLDGETGRDVDHWTGGDATPKQRAMDPQDHIDYQQLDEGHRTPTGHKAGPHDLGGLAAVAGAAAAVGAAAAIAASQSHSRQPSQEHEEWYRTSEDKKRDTLLTNPYEGTSPIVNLPGINDALLGGSGFDGQNYGNVYGSPLGHRGVDGHKGIDEGYISQGPNKTPDNQVAQAKGVNFDIGAVPTGAAGADDPFLTPGHAHHLSGMSQGMGSPFYDAATGTGIDRIESKDIIALMQHLMVRDAQRSARDTEILVTLVRSATEMRNNFEDLKRLLVDSEEVIINEVNDNTTKVVQRAINGPRPYPGSAPRSIHSQPPTINGDDINAKKRSIFRRALKGLSAKGANDLSRIEDMLNQLLNEVDVLKAQTAPPGTMPGAHQDEQSYDHLQPEGQYEQDHGYEPEGHAGTSTASHASQSGHLSLQSRGASAKPTYDRKASTHRISTVPEDSEEDYDHAHANDGARYSKPDMLMTPAQDQRGSSVPLATPPETAPQMQTSVSNENTPKTEEKKKSRGSWFKFPKMSRWSETTASSQQQDSRRNSQIPTGPSRSGSLGHYDDDFRFANPHQQVESDKLHTGFSEQDLARHELRDGAGSPFYEEGLQTPPQVGPGYVSMTPKPKTVHRDSLNLQHPQPRQGHTERFKAALESQALGFESSMTPKSPDWAGSATSLHRLPHHQQRDSYSSATGEASYQQHWTSSPAAANMMATAGPPRPPKEPLMDASPGMMAHQQLAGTPPQNKRLSKLQKGSPLPHHSVESGYGTMTHGVPTASYISHGGTTRDGGSPRLENRNLSGAQVSRRPSGPRPMTPSGRSGASGDGRESPAPGQAWGGDDRDRRRDTFGTMGSQDTDTF